MVWRFDGVIPTNQQALKKIFLMIIVDNPDLYSIERDQSFKQGKDLKNSF